MNLTNIKIGIVGFGIVGQAIHHAFSKQNHTITYYDKFLSETGSRLPIDHILHSMHLQM